MIYLENMHDDDFISKAAQQQIESNKLKTEIAILKDTVSYQALFFPVSLAMTLLERRALSEDMTRLSQIDTVFLNEIEETHFDADRDEKLEIFAQMWNDFLDAIALLSSTDNIADVIDAFVKKDKMRLSEITAKYLSKYIRANDNDAIKAETAYKFVAKILGVRKKMKVEAFSESYSRQVPLALSALDEKAIYHVELAKKLDQKSRLAGHRMARKAKEARQNKMMFSSLHTHERCRF